MALKQDLFFQIFILTSFVNNATILSRTGGNINLIPVNLIKTVSHNLFVFFPSTQRKSETFLLSNLQQSPALQLCWVNFVLPILN